VVRSAISGAKSPSERSEHLVGARFIEKGLKVVALNPNNTRRYFVDYTVNDVQHTLMVRTGSTVSAAALSGDVDSVLTAFASDLYEWTIRGLRVANAGSDVTNPATWSGSSSYGSGTTNDTIGRALAASYTGRDSVGHKVRSFFYGTKNLSEGDYRITRPESSVVADVLDALLALTDTFLTIGGNKPTWNQYANQVIPYHWVRTLRKTG